MKYIVAVLLISFLSSCTKQGINYEFKIPEDYVDWKKPIDEQLTYPVPGHGDGTRIIFANDLAFSVQKTKGESDRMMYDFPDGSIIVKEVYKKGADVKKSVPMLTIMVKNRKDPRNAAGWLYYLQKPGSEVVFVESAMCTGCHDAANEVHPYFDKNPQEEFRDYIFVKF